MPPLDIKKMKRVVVYVGRMVSLVAPPLMFSIFFCFGPEGLNVGVSPLLLF